MMYDRKEKKTYSRMSAVFIAAVGAAISALTCLRISFLLRLATIRYSGEEYDGKGLS